jgi:hypothetical protein
MPDGATTQWTVSVSQDTDANVRDFLTRRGMKTGDLSSFVEEAVKWRILDQTIAEARDAFADMAPDELDALLEEAVVAARAPSSAG